MQAKPTKYNEVTYDSQLEALWAIFSDHHPLITAWVPHMHLGQFVVDDEKWTPDQLIRMSTVSFLLEVKPSEPSNDYVEKLRQVARHFDTEVVIAIGSWYKDEIPMLRSSDDDFKDLMSLDKHILGSGRLKRTIEFMKSVRFDLNQAVVSPRSIDPAEFEKLKSEWLLNGRGNTSPPKK